MNFAEIENLALRVRYALFLIGSKEVDRPDSSVCLPLEWFSEYYATCRYEDLFRVRTSGMEELLGKNLLQGASASLESMRIK